MKRGSSSLTVPWLLHTSPLYSTYRGVNSQPWENLGGGRVSFLVLILVQNLALFLYCISEYRRSTRRLPACVIAHRYCMYSLYRTFCYRSVVCQISCCYRTVVCQTSCYRSAVWQTSCYRSAVCQTSCYRSAVCQTSCCR